ncbi:MAG: hypothetical protein ACRDL7_02045, partial [Gaiellaceae bacterium]
MNHRSNFSTSASNLKKMEEEDRKTEAEIDVSKDDDELETLLKDSMSEGDVPFDITSFLLKIGVKVRDLPFLTQGGLTEAEDFISIDNEAVDAYEITPTSKSVLRNYIIWRNDNIRSYQDVSDYVDVQKEGLIKARRRHDQAGASPTTRVSEAYDRTLIESLERQSVLLGHQSSVMKGMADAAVRKIDKPFVEVFKANSECPKFSGKDKHWSNFKRQFKAYLGAHGLSHILKAKVIDPEMTNYDRKYDEKNAWLHHTLMNHVGRIALSY